MLDHDQAAGAVSHFHGPLFALLYALILLFMREGTRLTRIPCRCFNTKPPHICNPPTPDPRSQSNLIVLVTNTCASYYDPSNTIGACNQKKGSKDALGSATVVDLCMDTDAAKAWWNSDTKAGLNVATIQQVDCKSWPGTIGPKASWLHDGYKGGPGLLDPGKKGGASVEEGGEEVVEASGRDVVEAEEREREVERAMVEWRKVRVLSQ